MDENKKELKQKKKEAKAQIKDLKRQQKDNRKEISRIKEESGQSHPSAVLTIVLVLIFLLILIILIKLDVGGFGSKVLGPVIGDVPYVNKILPSSAQMEVVSGNATAKNDTTEDKADEKTTEETTEATTQAATTRAPKNSDTETEGSSGSSGGSAASAAGTSSNTSTLDPTLQTYVDTYNSMDAKSAAPILEGMSGDYHLVAEILVNLEPQKRADILAAMSTNNAAKIMKIMERM